LQDLQELVREIKDKNDIVGVISEYTTLKRSGRGLLGLCPFHSEKTPSFNVNPDKQFFYCFGCGKGGDVISFIMKAENLDFIGAAKRLAGRAGVVWPEQQSASENDRQKEQLYKITKLAAVFFHHCLLKTEKGLQARQYLAKRNIAPDIWERFNLGYAPSGWHNLTEVFRQKGVSLELAESAGLVGFGENGFYDRFRDRLIFPIYDIKGNVAGFGGRVFDDSHPKYLNSPESVLFHKSNCLYGLYSALDTIRKKRQAIMVEGYFDVIQAHQAGFTQTIASLGTALTKEQVKIIKRFAAEAVLAYDGDNAGQNATQKGIELCGEGGLAVTVLNLPSGDDPDSLLKKGGAELFESMLNQRVNPVDYKIAAVIRKHDLNTPEGKADAVREVLPQLTAVDSTIAREAYIRRISREMGISETAVFTEFKRWLRNNGKNSQVLDRIHNNSYTKETGQNKQPGPNLPDLGQLTPLQKGIFEVEKELLQISLQEYDKFERIKEELEAEDFRFTVWRELFLALKQGQSMDGSPQAALEELAGSFREIAVALIAEKEVKNHPRDLPGVLNRFKMLQLQTKIQELTDQITAGRGPDGRMLDEADLKSKVLEFTELKRRLQKEFPHFSAEI
jgi:DNA primase